jgi:hypothetical protein
MDVGLLVILEFELFDNNKKNWFGFKATWLRGTFLNLDLIPLQNMTTLDIGNAKETHTQKKCQGTWTSTITLPTTSITYC